MRLLDLCTWHGGKYRGEGGSSGFSVGTEGTASRETTRSERDIMEERRTKRAREQREESNKRRQARQERNEIQRQAEALNEQREQSTIAEQRVEGQEASVSTLQQRAANLSEPVLQALEQIAPGLIAGSGEISARVDASERVGRKNIQRQINQLAGQAGSRLNTGVQIAGAEAEADLAVALAGLEEGLKAQERVTVLDALKGATTVSEQEQQQEVETGQLASTVENVQETRAQETTTLSELLSTLTSTEVEDILSILSEEETAELNSVIQDFARGQKLRSEFTLMGDYGMGF